MQVRQEEADPKNKRGKLGRTARWARWARWARYVVGLQPRKTLQAVSTLLTVCAHAMLVIKYFERRPWRWVSEER